MSWAKWMPGLRSLKFRCALIVLLGGAIVWALGGWLIHREIAETAAGDEGAYAPSGGGLEIGTLAASLNQMIDALTRQEAVNNAIVETAAVGLFTFDTSGSLETCNAAAAELFGHTSEELVGRKVWS